MADIKNLPPQAKFTKLKDVCTYSKGKKPQLVSKEQTSKISLPYINIKAFEKDVFEEYTDGEKCNLCEDGDLLMVWDGARAGFTGKAKKGAVGSTLMKIEPKTGLDKEYLYYFLLSQYRKLNTNPRGVGIPHVEPSLLWNTEFLFPDLKIQQAIVSKIEELFSELDKGIAELKLAQEQLKVYRQSVFKYAFEAKLTNENVKDGELPEGWEFVNIETLLIDVKKGMATGPFGTMLKKHEHQKSGVAVLGIENIGEGVFKLPNKIFVTRDKADELKNFKVNEDDVIISRSGTVGEICVIPRTMENSLISTNLIRVRLNKNIIAPKYFVYMFQGGQVRQDVLELCKGSSRAFLNQTILKSLKFPYCDIIEQNLVIQEIESRLSVADKMEESITESLQKAEALRQSILKKAFSGELVK